MLTQFSKRIKTKKILLVSAILLTALVGSILAIWQFSAMNFRTQGLVVIAQLTPSTRAQTIIDLPPFGEIIANTHSGPVEMVIRLERIETEDFKANLESAPSTIKFFNRLRFDFVDQARLFVLRQILLSLLGASLLLLLVWHPRFKTILTYSGLSTLILLVVLTICFYDYNFNAFSEPEYRGALTMAPGAMKMANDSLADLNKLKDQTNQIVGNLKGLFASVESLPTLSQPDRQIGSQTVLLVSDLHSNPVGIEFMKTLAQRFHVDLVINAGDLSDLGSAPETLLTIDLAELGVPQILVAGNHDTEAIIQGFASIPQSQVANGQMIEIQGLKVLGWPDSLSKSDLVEYRDKDEQKMLLNSEEEAIRIAITEQGTPDILVVHNSNLAAQLIDLAPLVVTGHNHQMGLRQKAGHTLINPGTVGAAGLRGLYSESGAGYSAAIVYIQPGTGPMAVDMIRYNPVSQQFSLERQVILTANMESNSL